METLNENAISKHENTILIKQLNISSKQKEKQQQRLGTLIKKETNF